MSSELEDKGAYIKRQYNLKHICGINIHNTTFKETIAEIEYNIAKKIHCFITTANLDFLYRAHKDKDFRKLLLRSNFIVPDGFPLILLSRILGQPLRERVTGSDLVPKLAKVASKKGYRLLFIGGREGVAIKAKEKLESYYPDIKIVGTYSPPFTPLEGIDSDKIINLVNETKADIVLFALGTPKQEKWISQNFKKSNPAVYMGVGGTFDFIAGLQPRAPKVFQKFNLEWLWRLSSDPKRLFPRYARNGYFFALVVSKLYLHKLHSYIIRGINKIFRKNDEDEEKQTIVRTVDGTIEIDLLGKESLDSEQLSVISHLMTLCEDSGLKIEVKNSNRSLNSLLSLCKVDSVKEEEVSQQSEISP